MIKELPLTPEGVKHFELWIAALRSGKYKQGYSHLKNADGTMCCMGVSCDVIDPKAWHKPPAEKNEPNAYFWRRPDAASFRGADAYPDDDWAEMLFGAKFIVGMAWSEANMRVTTLKHTLSAMNDSQGRSYDEIADALQYFLDDKQYTMTEWASEINSPYSTHIPND